jgi:tetratricopeptide (TPR) repeat protein
MAPNLALAQRRQIEDMILSQCFSSSDIAEVVGCSTRSIRTIKERTLAEEHPSRLASQHELAGAYESNGQIKKAVALLEQVVAVDERTLAEDHPSRLASQHALAGAYESNGQIKKAVALLEQVVTIKERTLAEEHPDRLASLSALENALEMASQ